MKKWAVPAHIRGFDSSEPPMSRFCLWETVSFTRFWSLQLPFLAWFKRFWSRIFSQRDLIYEVLISGKTIYILYIMYIRGFDLSAGEAQGADSRGLYLSPTCGIPKTRSKPRKWGDAGRGRGRHQMWFTFIKKQQDIGNPIGRSLRKTLIFAGKGAGKTGLLPIREVEIHKNKWKAIILYRVYR